MTWFCVEKLGRLPSELDEIPMSVLMSSFIAWTIMQERITPK